MDLFTKGKQRVARVPKFQTPLLVKDSSQPNRQNNSETSTDTSTSKLPKLPLASGSIINKYVIPSKLHHSIFYSQPGIVSKEYSIYSDEDVDEPFSFFTPRWKRNIEIRHTYYLRRRTKRNELNERVIAERQQKLSLEWHERLYGPIKKKKRAVAEGTFDEDGVGKIIHGKFPPGRNSYKTKIGVQVKSEYKIKKESWSDGNISQLKINLARGDSFLNWNDLLTGMNIQRLESLPSVASFNYAPFSDIWNELAVSGAMIEILNPFEMEQEDTYWIAKIQRFAGYYCLLEFETFDWYPMEATEAIWVNFCSDRLKPLGWSNQNGKKLHPGSLLRLTPNASALDAQLNGIFEKQLPTIPWNHTEIFRKKLFEIEDTWNRFGTYEALDINSLHQNRLCRIFNVVGNRIQINYWYERDSEETALFDPYKYGFWFDCKTRDVHPFMWSHSVGVKINGINPDFRGLYLRRGSFPPWPEETVSIEEGMKLEARHSFILDKIVSAVIIKVLNYGYFMIETREIKLASRGRFVHHVTSPFIFPVGWGQAHDIYVDGVEEGRVGFGDFTGATNNNYLRLDLLQPRAPHNFAVGNFVEVIEIQNSEFLGPATVEKIAGHLLLLKFCLWEGATGNACQWVDSVSSEIYPMGYSEILLSHRWYGFNKPMNMISVSSDD